MDNYIEVFGLSLECARIPAMIVNEENIIVHTNQSMTTLFGDLVGHHRSYLFASDFGYDFNRPDPFVDILADIQGDDNNAEAIIADVTYEVICQHITCEAGTPFTVMFFEDITKKKSLETEVSESLKSLRRETSIAKDIQNSILPTDNEYWNTIRISAEYLPAGDLGGDVYDIIGLSDDEVLFYIADVSGHGIQASLLTIYLRENIRANMGAARENLNALTQQLLKSYKSLDIDAGMYIGILLCKYNRVKNEMSVLNAGHNCYPLIIRQTGRVEEIPIRGMPLSLVSDENSYEPESIGVYSGDRLVLFTDGLVEEQGVIIQEPFGSEAIRHIAEEHCRLDSKNLAKIIVEKSSESAIGKAKDDRTVVVVDIL